MAPSMNILPLQYSEVDKCSVCHYTFKSNEIETLALDGIPAAPILAKPQQVRFAPSTSEKKG